MGDYSKRFDSSKDKPYRDCMAEIIGVLKKYDMAGAVTVVSKERCMFKYHFPKWTAVELGETSLRLRLKGSEFASGEDARRCAELTAHAIMQMGDCASTTLGMVKHISEIMRDKWGMEHHGGTDFDPELSN
jgi:hypothetical protein